MWGGRSSWHQERGTEWLEWVIVTLILTIAIFALLQAVGGHVAEFLLKVRLWLQSLGLK